MARLNDRRCHTAFMDSRAEGIQKIVDELNDNEYLAIRQLKGANLHQLTQAASAHLKSYPFDVVYIIGGACDITYKDHRTKEISFNWSPPGSLTDHLLSTISYEDSFMRSTHPAARVVFCTLVGVDLARVVSRQIIEREQQEAVNEAVFAYNTEIFAVNKKRGTFSPSLHRTVHRSARGKNKCHYHHLEDGIHLSENLQCQWATELVKAVKAN